MAPKRILQVIGGLDNGGSQAMILNIYRKIDREKVQFDFIVDHPDEMYFASEVKALGGKIHIMPTFTGFNLQEILKAWNDFFITHPEYKIIHAHVRSYASIFLSIAKKHGLVTISHSHSTSSGKGLKAVVKNILQIRLRYVADYMMSCSYHAGEWLFGKKAADSERHFVINNAVDVPKYVYSKARSDEQREKWGIRRKTGGKNTDSDPCLQRRRSGASRKLPDQQQCGDGLFGRQAENALYGKL